MKASWMNTTHIEGVVFDHSLEKKVSGEKSKNPGTAFINGIVNIATDDACNNVVPVHFSYVTATTSRGAANSTYNVLSRLIDENQCVASVGQENAMRVRIDSAIGLNEWFKDLKDEKPISTMRNEGGFAHIVTDALNADEKARSTFKVDMVITNTRDVEANPERDLPAKLVVEGYIFDFRKALLPASFSVINPDGIKYFQKLNCSPNTPVVTQVWGRQISQTIKTKIVSESAFGEDFVRFREDSNRDFVITGTAREPYIWDDENCITATEMKQALQDREIVLATMKKNQEEYQNNRSKKTDNSTTSSPVASTIAGGYNF